MLYPSLLLLFFFSSSHDGPVTVLYNLMHSCLCLVLLVLGFVVVLFVFFLIEQSTVYVIYGFLFQEYILSNNAVSALLDFIYIMYKNCLKHGEGRLIGHV